MRAHDLALGLAFGGSAFDVGAGALAVTQTTDDDQVQSTIGLVIAAIVEAVASRLARGGGDRAGAAYRGERALAAEPVDVLPGSDQQLAGLSGRDAEQLGAARRRGRDELLELAVQGRDLTIESLDPLGDRSQCELRCLERRVKVAGRGSLAEGRSRAQTVALPRSVLRGES